MNAGGDTSARATAGDSCARLPTTPSVPRASANDRWSRGNTRRWGSRHRMRTRPARHGWRCRGRGPLARADPRPWRRSRSRSDPPCSPSCTRAATHVLHRQLDVLAPKIDHRATGISAEAPDARVEVTSPRLRSVVPDERERDDVAACAADRTWERWRRSHRRMRIGILAARLGTTPHAIRFYDRQSLLPFPQRRGNGYRECTSEDEARLRLLIGLRQLDLPLGQAAELATMCVAGRCNEVSVELRQVLAEKRAEVARRVQ